ncbi:MAG: hypothetical protein ACPLZD_09830 [Candidatus Saccharicenans sp.]
MGEITFLKNVTDLLDERSTKHFGRVAYHITHSLIAFIAGIGFFAILFVEANNRLRFQACVDIMLAFILFILTISSLARYISQTEISLWKINHFPIKKQDIYLAYLFSDIFSFRNISSLTVVLIITAFLIKNYGLFAISSLLFLLTYFFSIIVWIRTCLFILEKLLSKKSIKDNLYSLLLTTIIIVFILSYILDKIRTEETIISIFSYTPMGWAGNGIFCLQEHFYIQALLNFAWLCLFSFVGLKIGIILIKRLGYV